MKKPTTILFGVLLFNIASAQMVATMEVKEPIPGSCDPKTIYALFSGWKGQKEAVPMMTREELLAKLQKEVTFVKDNPTFKGKIMVSCIVNCKGELIKCYLSIKSGNDELDKQVLEIFKGFTNWNPGTLNGTPVDDSQLFSYEIKKGKIKE